MSDFFSYDGPAEPAGRAAGASGSGPASPLGARPAPQAPRELLAELGSEEWEKLIGFAIRRRYPPGAVIVAVGDSDPALGFVSGGEVELRDPAGASTRLAEGAVFGLLSFLDGAPSQISVAVTTAGAPAEVLLLSPQALQRLSAWEPRIAMALLRDLGANVAARLRHWHPGD